MPATAPIAPLLLFRAIHREPHYVTRSPRYCQLVFGKSARTKAWVVLDGDDLYIDRRGTGDLTEDGNRVESQEKRLSRKSRSRTWLIGEVAEVDTGERHTGLVVHWDVNSRGEELYIVGIRLRGRIDQQAGGLFGTLTFGKTYREAPIVHFNGTLSFALDELQRGRIYRSAGAGRPDDLIVNVGTPGLGKGSFAWLDLAVFPRDKHPVAELVLPASSDSSQGATVRSILNQRC
jgi:hypothetical protein